jgi:hypothetical protein
MPRPQLRRDVHELTTTPRPLRGRHDYDLDHYTTSTTTTLRPRLRSRYHDHDASKATTQRPRRHDATTTTRTRRCNDTMTTIITPLPWHVHVASSTRITHDHDATTWYLRPRHRYATTTIMKLRP